MFHTQQEYQETVKLDDSVIDNIGKVSPPDLRVLKELGGLRLLL